MSRPWRAALHAALAGGLLASILVAALHDASQAWDVWYYHMPFAARLAGVVGPDAYVLHAANAARFEGFPLLGELVQGLLWRVTGRPQAANLLAFASVPLFAFFLRRRFAVPMPLTVVGLLAVPLVHTHASSSYVDLPANAALAAIVLLSLRAWAAPPEPRVLAWALGGAAFVVNTKAQLQPLAALALLAVGARVVPVLMRRRARGALALVALALPLVFATPLKNLARHHNPWYPVAVEVLGHRLPGPEEAYRSTPKWLEHAPQPARFAASIFELGLRPIEDPRRWTIDQWTPHDHTGYRMGGYFGAYVFALLALLAWRIITDRAREVKVAGLIFCAFTAAVSVMPQSHELRYYMGWMIVLVAINLWLACRSDAARGPGPGVFGALSIAAALVVLLVTRGAYAWPTGRTFTELVRAKTDERFLSGLHKGERVCIAREPFVLLWAAPFHPPGAYVVEEAEDASDCADKAVPE